METYSDAVFCDDVIMRDSFQIIPEPNFYKSF